MQDLVEEEAGLEAGVRGCQVAYGRHPSLVSGGRARLCSTVNRPSGMARATSMPPRVAAKNKPSCTAAASCKVIMAMSSSVHDWAETWVHACCCPYLHTLCSSDMLETVDIMHLL